MSMAQRIIEFKKSNPHASPSDIADALGVKRTSVYSALSYHAKKKTKPAAKRGRPRKFVTPVIEMQTIKHNDRPDGLTIDDVMLEKIRAATDGVQEMKIESLEHEITQLKAVIRYLEGKVYGASV